MKRSFVPGLMLAAAACGGPQESYQRAVLAEMRPKLVACQEVSNTLDSLYGSDLAGNLSADYKQTASAQLEGVQNTLWIALQITSTLDTDANISQGTYGQLGIVVRPLELRLAGLRELLLNQDWKPTAHDDAVWEACLTNPYTVAK